MKRNLVFVTMVAMLFFANGFAQDSYRVAVKDYLLQSGQFEKAKSLISDMSLLFVKDGPVDIDQLTKRYFDERCEDDMIDLILPTMKERGMTEADLKEVSSLLSRPENKTFEDHQAEWMSGFIADLLMPFLKIGEDLDSDENQESGENMESGNLMTLLGSPVQPRADIDSVFSAKFNEVILESVFMKNMMDAMMKRLTEDPTGKPKNQEDLKALNDWMNSNISALLLNNAYGTLTLEDLDFVALLYSNDAYCKMADFVPADSGNNPISNVVLKYVEWMKEQGATESDDPRVTEKLLKSLLNLDDIDFDE